MEESGTELSCVLRFVAVFGMQPPPFADRTLCPASVGVFFDTRPFARYHGRQIVRVRD
jgi:hypothetical protein